MSKLITYSLIKITEGSDTFREDVEASNLVFLDASIKWEELKKTYASKKNVKIIMRKE